MPLSPALIHELPREFKNVRASSQTLFRIGFRPMRASCRLSVSSVGSTRNTSVLLLLSFAMLIVSLDQYIVVVALPEIGRDLRYSPQTLQTVISAYAVTASGFLLLGGRAADLLGGRRILTIGLVLYAIASFAGGLTTTPAFL